MAKTSLQSSASSPLEDLLAKADWPAEEAEELRQLEAAVRGHRLFTELNAPARLVAFAEVHVFAVWDFMALLHSVRLGICPGEILWTPPVYPQSSRLLHEILLEEECGLSMHGEPLSHFESYLLAMRGMGASPKGVLGFVEDLRAGVDAADALDRNAPPAARAFVQTTLTIARGALADRIAVLCVGRERLIPEMFPILEASVAGLVGPLDLAPFRFYLERHIEVDGGAHGPASAELVGIHARGNLRAAQAACAALKARIALWDAILISFSEE